MPRGELFYYRHKEEVTDGTPCTDDKYDVCVEGICQPVGCDRMLGSNEVEDQCRICGGDGSMCNTISDISNIQDLQVGYNDILLIPEGATNILVQEVAESNNYLAVRDRHGNYYLNGNWTIDFPRTLDIAGCRFVYDRYPRGFMAPDSLRCLGPTNEPLIIVLLFQNSNVGIQYQYSVPKNVLMGDNETYAWIFSEFSPCTTSCGGGVQYRNISCAGRKSLQPVEDSLCDISNEPESIQECAQQPCEPRWITEPWGRCSASCGSMGFQNRRVYCEQTIREGYTVIVDDRYCVQEDKPENQRQCNRGKICATWHTTPWKPCDRLCGQGRETREVTCYRKVDNRIEVLDDYECEQEESKPEGQRPCNLRPCEGLDWVTSEWSGCEHCGTATETRRVECATQDGQLYPREMCENIPLPITERQCDENSKKCSQQWYATQWSECSAKCGNGMQTREVFCATINGEGIQKIDDSNCDPDKRYDDTKECVGDRETCPGEWFTGPWSECSAPCNGGQQTRKVICMKDNLPSDPAECDPSTIPYQTEPCNPQQCTEDEMKTTAEPVTYVNETLSTSQPDLIMDYDYEEVYDETCENGEWVNEDDSTLPNNVQQNQKASFVDDSFYDFDSMLGDDPNVYDTRLDDEGSGDEDTSSESSTSSEYTDEDYSTEGSGESSETTDFTDTSSISTVSSSLKPTPEVIPPVGETDIGAKDEDEFPFISTESSTSDTTEFTYSTGTPVSSSSESTISSSSESTFSTESTSEVSTETITTESTISEATFTSSSTSDETTESDVTFTTLSSSTDTTSDVSTDTTSEVTTDSSLSTETPLSSSTESTSEITTESSGPTESTSEVTTESPASTETVISTSSISTTSGSTESTETPISTVSEESSTTVSTESTSQISTESTSEFTTDSSVSTSEITTVSKETTTSLSSSTGETSETSMTESTPSTQTEVSGTTESTESTSEISTISTSEVTTVSPLSTETEVTSSTISVPSESTSATESTSQISTESTVTGTTESTPSVDSSSEISTQSSSSIATESSVSTTLGSTDSTTEVSTEETSEVTSVSTPSIETEETASSETVTTIATESTNEMTTESGPSTETEESSSIISTSSIGTETSSEATTETALSSSTISSTSGATESSQTSDGSSLSTESTQLTGSSTLGSSESTSLSTASTESSVFTTVTDIWSSIESTVITESTTSETTESGSTESSTLEMTYSTESTPSPGTSESTSEVSSLSTISESTISSTSEMTESTHSTESPTTIESTSEISSSTETTQSSSTIESSSVMSSSTESASTMESTTELTISRGSTESSSTVETSSEISSSTESTVSSSTVESTSEITVSTGSTESTSTIESSTEISSSTESTVSSSTLESTSEGSSESTESSSTIQSSSEITGSTESTESTTEISLGSETTGSVSTVESTPLTSSTSQSTETSPSSQSAFTMESTAYDAWGTTSITEIFSTPKLRKCRKKVRKHCSKSKYGCCIDKVTPAKGPFDKGCPVVTTCNETRFGCCDDGVSVAMGKNFEGCPAILCAASLYGCCLDNRTAALGNDYEGCPPECLQSLYGCCEDNYTEAKGPNWEGCVPTTTETSTSSLSPETSSISTTIETSTIESTSEVSSTITETPITPTGSTTLSTVAVSVANVSCQESLYNCCPDGVSAATGVDYEGCDIFRDNCTESYFGCCPDGVTSARGPYYKACKMPCEESMFGCCEDGVTPSHGPYREGCCLTTQYGCCPDNIRPSQGPNLEGCGCQYSPYRCCPDNVTAAQGYYNEGCGCQYTRYGCCPDNFTEAIGVNYEGCSCRTFQFGCCPDGVSVAQGSQLQGCGCRYTEFGCCSDGQTPAQGQEQEGCGCESSQYGCCMDGVSEASGSNFEGCKEIPVSLQASCSLEKERGPCRNYTVKWFFDMEYGGCSRFWYGGCDGNGNRFKSKEECNSVCIEPEGKDRCSLPKVSGTCDGYYPKWYYDAAQKTCSQFVYSGCLGNNNNFNTREECMDQCAEATYLDSCDQSVEVGPCRGSFIRWYYDKNSGSCNQFIYGGCKANGNNFPSESACKQQCTQLGQKKDSCSLPLATGNCHSQDARWYFSETERRCMPFYFSGCEGNLNNFISQEACESDCPKEIVKGTCQLPAEIGDCSDYVQRWYYDTTYKQCRLFYYGGCAGNGNNFETEQDCEQRCKTILFTPAPPTPPPAVPVTIGTFRPEFCFLDSDVGPCRNYDPRWYYDRNDGSCKQFMYGGCPGNGNNFYTDTECEEKCSGVQDLCTLPPLAGPCGSGYERWYYNPSIDACETFNYGGCLGNANKFYDKYACEVRCQKRRTTTTTSTLASYVPKPTPGPSSELSICYVPVDTGNCSDSIPSYYYDPRAQKCLAFVYTGCGGNANRFTSEEQCERQCGRFRGLDVCKLPRDTGPCRGYLRKFYYDAVYGHCGQFVYGGCDGNGNRFSSQEECENVCVTHEEQKPTLISNETKSTICRLPLDVGPCEGGYYKHYYFDDFRGECASFIYSGCGGNFNNFKTFQACLDFCKDYLVPTEPPIIPYTEKSTEHCQQYIEECGTLICEYGTEAFVDDATTCTKCRCHDPCTGVLCRQDQRCAVDLNRNRTTYDDPTFIAVCRDVQKEGDCPVMRSHGKRCERDCEDDADCTLDLKCCPTNCGTVCIAPTVPIPAQLITSSPQPAYTPPHTVYYPPVIDEEKFQPQVSAGEGDFATLDCSVQGNPTPQIAWRKGDLIIDGTQPRYRILLDGTLQIITLHKTDAGIYLCAADNGIGRPIEKEINLQVTDSEPHATAIVGDQENSHIVASLGAPTTLHCYATGFPFPSVTWWKDDRLVPLHTHQFEVHKDYSLLIHSVQLSNLGIYTCQAYNGIGKAASWSVTVQTLGPVYSTRPEDVKYMQYVINAPERPTPRPLPPTIPTKATTPSPTPEPPKHTTLNISLLTQLPTEEPPYVYQVPVKVRLTSTQTTYPTGKDISIGCDVEGYPIPQVQWYKDGQPLYPSEAIHISENHRLSIHRAKESDTGEYRCEAANDFSRSYAATTITVQVSHIEANCTDNPFFANCQLIVRANYCIHKYYARFCCKSCTEAGQLPSNGAISDDKDTALRSNMITK
ncbi:papilin isoform X1 [Photinus pyralis]|uniref:papilin isoform X1 n=1 Tax=Photinus pyralis TaxID=7054 RepID=UPI001267613D|nr:papilin isoform X1 [Photinus pyralis]